MTSLKFFHGIDSQKVHNAEELAVLQKQHRMLVAENNNLIAKQWEIEHHLAKKIPMTTRQSLIKQLAEIQAELTKKDYSNTIESIERKIQSKHFEIYGKTEMDNSSPRPVAC